MTSRYIRMGSKWPLHNVISRQTMKRKFFLKATPLVLLFLSAAIHTCACPYELHGHEGPGPAERACLGVGKRKRRRRRIASNIDIGSCSVKAFLKASQISLNRTLKALCALELPSCEESRPLRHAQQNDASSPRSAHEPLEQASL